jgi:hypothetical protein
MGTRSDIIVHLSNGTWHRVYCHWDGYLEGNGKILQKHYNTQERAEELVKPGDMSSLHPRCDKPKGHTFDKPVDGYTVYYGRDRGEKDTGGTKGKTLQAVWPEEDCWTEFTYVWHEGEWWVTSPDEGTQTLVKLAEALAGKVTVKANVKVFGCVIGKHKPTKPGKPHGWSGAL